MEKKSPTPSVLPPHVDALVESLRTDGATQGATAEPGEFTLDRDVALKKLRQFQLADPPAYVLELLQAAVLKGATWIDFRIDTDDTWMRFDGAPFTATELQEVYAAVFRSDSDDATRALRQLALGLNAALGLSPRWIQVRSGLPGQRVAFELRRDQHQPVGGLAAEVKASPGRDPDEVTTEIHVKARFRPALVRRFVKNLRSMLPEEWVLRRRARFCTLDVKLDGGNIAWGLTVEDAVHTVTYDRPGITCRCSLVPGFDPPKVHWVVNGALITTTELRGKGGEGFVAVVQANGLRKDVSQTSIVVDELYEEALALIDRGRNKLKNTSSGKKDQIDQRLEIVTDKLDDLFVATEIQYELLHRIAHRAAKVGWMFAVVTMLTFAATPLVGKNAWWIQAISMTLTVLTFLAPPVCGTVAHSLLGRARNRFDHHFSQGTAERKLARRGLQKREDDENGTLAQDMKTRS